MGEQEREMVNHLMEAIMTLKTTEECEKFFVDICSADELTKISRRVQIAKLIIEGKTYRSILEETNASNITISRIKNVLSKDDSVLAEVVKRI
ncbi:MAG: TrpR YerC/YecD [Clostridium sp.]|nr:TrpR YerC/YecD [Clostridium sp.]